MGEPRSLDRRRLLRDAGLLGLAAIAGCAAPRQAGAAAPSALTAPTSASPSRTASPSPSPSGPTPSPTPDEAVLRRTAAGLLVVGFVGTSAPDWLRRALDEGLGGVLLFGRNLRSPDQARGLVASLRARRPHLLVAIDQEGGSVARLGPADGFAATLSAQDVGAHDDLALAGRWGATLADQVRSIGADLNLAPVVDLGLVPDSPAIGALHRAFSSDPEVVATMAGAVVRAHRSRRVRTSVKHFPGLGSAHRNTDSAVVDVTATWRPDELVPYRRLLAAGLVDSVMVGHVLDRHLDPTLPASLSPSVVDGLLRHDLGWHGPVLTDSLEAVAIRTRYSPVRAAQLALLAGADVLLHGNHSGDPHLVGTLVDGLADRVRAGTLAEARLQQAARRADSLRS